MPKRELDPDMPTKKHNLICPNIQITYKKSKSNGSRKSKETSRAKRRRRTSPAEESPKLNIYCGWKLETMVEVNTQNQQAASPTMRSAPLVNDRTSTYLSYPRPRDSSNGMEYQGRGFNKAKKKREIVRIAKENNSDIIGALETKKNKNKQTAVREFFHGEWACDNLEYGDNLEILHGSYRICYSGKNSTVHIKTSSHNAILKCWRSGDIHHLVYASTNSRERSNL